MKKITAKDIEKMSIAEFIEWEYKHIVKELTKMGILGKEKDKNANKRNPNHTS